MGAMATRSTSADLIARVPLFAACSKKELRSLASAAAERAVGAGNVVVRQGAAGNAFFVILSGEADVIRNGRKVGHLVPGDFFGDLALIDKLPRSATVVATTDTVLVVLGQREFSALLEESTTFARKLLVGLATRVRELDARAD